MVWILINSRRQTADDCSRRSKTKCSGTRPQCRRCLRRKLACSWPRTHALGTPESLDISQVAAIPEVHKSIEPISTPAAFYDITPEFPGAAQLQRLLDIFFTRHHDVELCSFLHKPTTDMATLSVHAPFLVASIISLSALYISEDEARRIFDFQSAAALSGHYAQLARNYAHSLSDMPSGQCYH